jgi:hypothetical protein
VTCQLHNAEAATTVAALGPCVLSCSRCPCRPSDYALNAAELRAEIARCIAAGWKPWEIDCRFAQPHEMGVAA